MIKLGYGMFGLTGLCRGRKRLVLAAFLVISLLGCAVLPRSESNGSFSNGRISTSRSFSAQALPVGDAARGRDLFMGNIHFQNSGPPCMGCHNISDNGILGGGVLGPDLTNVSTRYSETDLTAILIDPGPIMKPIFSEHPLTLGEQADLLAFLQASAGQPETNREIYVIAISLAGLLVAVGLAEVVYHRRLRGVRKPFVKKARLGKL